MNVVKVQNNKNGSKQMTLPAEICKIMSIHGGEKLLIVAYPEKHTIEVEIMGKEILCNE